VSRESLSAYGNGLTFDYPFIETEKLSTLAAYGNGLVRKTAVIPPGSEHIQNPVGRALIPEIIRGRQVKFLLFPLPGVVYHDSHCRSKFLLRSKF